jgi:ketosteroid isomerase-like protein
LVSGRRLGHYGATASGGGVESDVSRSPRTALYVGIESALIHPEIVLAEHPNVATFHSIYTAFTTGDIDTLATFFDKDVVWHTPGQHQLAGTYEGRDATFASFAEEFERSGGSYGVDVRDVLANDEHIVAFLHATANREGRRLDQEYVIVFEMREGVVRAAWEVWKDQPSVDDFWS